MTVNRRKLKKTCAEESFGEKHGEPHAKNVFYQFESMSVIFAKWFEKVRNLEKCHELIGGIFYF